MAWLLAKAWPGRRTVRWRENLAGVDESSSYTQRGSRPSPQCRLQEGGGVWVKLWQRTLGPEWGCEEVSRATAWQGHCSGSIAWQVPSRPHAAAPWRAPQLRRHVAQQAVHQGVPIRLQPGRNRHGRQLSPSWCMPHEPASLQAPHRALGWPQHDSYRRAIRLHPTHVPLQYRGTQRPTCGLSGAGYSRSKYRWAGRPSRMTSYLQKSSGNTAGGQCWMH